MTVSCETVLDFTTSRPFAFISVTIFESSCFQFFLLRSERHLSGCLQKLSLFDNIYKNKKPETPKIDLPAGLSANHAAAFEPISKTPAFR